MSEWSALSLSEVLKQKCNGSFILFLMDALQRDFLVGGRWNGIERSLKFYNFMTFKSIHLKITKYKGDKLIAKTLKENECKSWIYSTCFNNQGSMGTQRGNNHEAILISPFQSSELLWISISAPSKPVGFYHKVWVGRFHTDIGTVLKVAANLPASNVRARSSICVWEQIIHWQASSLAGMQLCLLIENPPLSPEHYSSGSRWWRRMCFTLHIREINLKSNGHTERPGKIPNYLLLLCQ